MEQLATCNMRVRDIGGELHAELKSISAKIGVTKTKFIKVRLLEALQNYPDYMKVKRVKCAPCTETSINGMSTKHKEQLQNIADFAGVDVGDLIKIKLVEAAMTYPGEYKVRMME